MNQTLSKFFSWYRNKFENNVRSVLKGVRSTRVPEETGITTTAYVQHRRSRPCSTGHNGMTESRKS